VALAAVIMAELQQFLWWRQLLGQQVGEAPQSLLYSSALLGKEKDAEE
jgi:hypothetical protein